MEETSFVTILENAVRRQALLGATLLVGVSGGADSLALLHGLARLAEPLNLTLVVAHFDHHLRAESSDDARFVELVAQSLALPVRIGSADVRRLSRERGMGVEEAARHARLRFFAELMVETGAASVVLGHTKDDQAETRLLHLIRGAGLDGLVGMAEISALTIEGHVVRVFRPLLLEVGRTDTERYCAASRLQPRDDHTNRDLAFSRNRIRHSVLPPMRDLNPRVDDALERLARTAGAAREFIGGELDRRLPALLVAREPRWVIRRQPFRQLPDALKRSLVHRAAEAVGAAVGAEAIETAIEAGDSWPAGTKIDWPAGRVVQIEHDWLSIGPCCSKQDAELRRKTVVLPLADAETPLRLPGSLGGRERPSEVLLRVRRRAGRCVRPRDRWHADFDARRLGGSLGLRFRRSGDRLAAEGIDGTKKLQDILVDAHIPRGDRDLVPVLTSEDSVVWVIGLRRNREFLAGPTCEDVLCCEVQEYPANDRG